MALVGSAGSLAAVVAIFLIAAAFGNRALRLVEPDSASSGPPAKPPCSELTAVDKVLFSSGAGFAALQLFVAVLSFVHGLTFGSVIALLALMALASGRGWKAVLRLAAESWTELSGVFEARAAKALGIGIAFFAGLEALISTAPLTGSDAMHYHFTAPFLQLGKPEQPIFWLTHSFLTGLAHETIGMGLALGGDRLALLLIFLGGFLTTLALLQLARKLMPLEWALSTALVFTMAPMVFWQISTAGSPDIWMGFYALLAVLAMEHGDEGRGHRWLILASVYAGAGAGIKYTGWIVPAAIVLIALWSNRSVLWTALCSIAALATGAFPLLRNFIWTGDPFFPFLNQWIGRVPANSYGMRLLQADIHAHLFSRQPLHILYFFATMTMKGADYGFGNYFGPVVLAFLPLLYFCNWKERLTWIAGIVWLSILFANALTTQMARFLLPTFPLALALVFSGAAACSRKATPWIRWGCAGTLVVFGLFCIASDMLYARDFLSVSLGREGRGAFLTRMAPDYQAATFLNSALERRNGSVLVFLRHLYYLRVPYVYGDPDSSWITNPEALTTPQALAAFLKEHDVRWVAKAPDYPRPLAAVFEESEKEGILIPETRTEVLEFSGVSRTLNNRRESPLVLLRVAR
jgi:4-amino-4-deoxy-L-arabinose transferase-like glycosyltransferase